MLQHEQLRTKKGGLEQGRVLIKQLTGEPKLFTVRSDIPHTHSIAWMYREAPFEEPCSGLLHRLAWWEARAKDSNASVLAVRLIQPDVYELPG